MKVGDRVNIVCGSLFMYDRTIVKIDGDWITVSGPDNRLPASAAIPFEPLKLVGLKFNPIYSHGYDMAKEYDQLGAIKVAGDIIDFVFTAQEQRDMRYEGMLKDQQILNKALEKIAEMQTIPADLADKLFELEWRNGQALKGYE